MTDWTLIEYAYGKPVYTMGFFSKKSALFHAQCKHDTRATTRRIQPGMYEFQRRHLIVNETQLAEYRREES